MTPSDRIRETFSVFSNRQSPTAQNSLEHVPNSFRDRLILLYREHLSLQPYAADDFSQEIIKRLQMLKGDINFGTPSKEQKSAGAFLGDYIRHCSTNELLDLIELAFKVTVRIPRDFHAINNSNNEFINAINDLFQLDQLTYQLTPMVYRYGNESGLSTGHVAEYPKVIISEEELTHTEAVLPALHALADPSFASANSEFREALNDYREGMYGDCIRNCCNSLESTIKAIHQANKWPVSEQATLAPLVESLFTNTPIPPSFKQTMSLVGTIRNKMSTVHGAGNSPKNPDHAMTRFILTTTAAVISCITEYA